MKKWLWIIAIVIIVFAGAVFFASRASISALDDPGKLETRVATEAKHEIVSRAAHDLHVTPPAFSQASANTGQMIFMGECSTCHGTDGRTPTDIGKAMYPRVPDLGSPEIQKWSDAELFWIIQHGVRLSGMPGFAHSNSPAQIWDLVQFIRTLPNQPKQQN